MSVPYNKIVFNTEQLLDIKQLYLSGNSCVSIAKKYGVNHHTILTELHEMNIDVDRRSCRKYSLNTEYFDCIDSQNKAYIFGFLMADGHNSICKSTVSMSLHEQDGYILEEMRKELGCTKPLEYIDYSNKHDFGYKYSNQYRLILFSSHMCDTLNRLGMTHDKSHSLKFPNIGKEYYPHFIRGYFDGNGTINKKAGSFGIVSAEAFVDSLMEIFQDELGVVGGIKRESSCKNGVTFDLHYHKHHESKKICEWMYKDAEMFLKRKYELYLLTHNGY